MPSECMRDATQARMRGGTTRRSVCRRELPASDRDSRRPGMPVRRQPGRGVAASPVRGLRKPPKLGDPGVSHEPFRGHAGFLSTWERTTAASLPSEAEDKRVPKHSMKQCNSYLI